MQHILLEGPFESDYSLAIVNRRLALALLEMGSDLMLHQRDNTTSYFPSRDFLRRNPGLADRFIASLEGLNADIHSRYIYPPFTDNMPATVRVMHCYGWEESGFPRRYVEDFNRNLDLITVMSRYVRQVLLEAGVTLPIEVVGLGADHILEHSAEPIGGFESEGFHFVHISSCFPRKGADVLVEAFCREFSRGDEVHLVIKTFDNPHNEIRRILAEAFAKYPRHAPVRLIFDSLSPGNIRYLIERSNCLVAPSRGEGFGLPAAEAMLLGTPVIATIHGGHADLCSPETCWPVDFRLAPAQTHLTEGPSVWAEPHVDSLAARMREIYESGSDVLHEKVERARAHVRNFTWARTAQAHERACAEVLAVKRDRISARAAQTPRHIGFISTWNARCGIAEYTRYLAENLGANYRCSVFANRIDAPVRPDQPFVSRCWTATMSDIPRAAAERVAERICAAGCDSVSIQYNFGLLSPKTVEIIVDRLKNSNVSVFLTLHATAHENLARLTPTLKKSDAVIVHRASERDLLLSSGVDRVVLQKQGIPSSAAVRRRPVGSSDLFTVACFGFFLPPKGIYELLEAFEAAAFVNPALRLKLLNSLYDSSESHAYASECLALIRRRRLTERVLICTDFLDDETVLDELGSSDLIVLPYTHSSESSSAAIRLPLASLRPVLCSDLEVFHEFSDIVHTYPAQDVVALANRMIELSLDEGRLREFESKQRDYVEDLSWRNVARRFEEIIAGHVFAETACAVR